MFDTIKKVLIQNREDDALLYEYVLTEIENEVILKGLWAKAMALSEGNDNKIQPLYMQYRVQSIKDEFTKLNIAYKELTKKPLFEKIASFMRDDQTQEPKTKVENNVSLSYRKPNDLDNFISEVNKDIAQIKKDFLGIEKPLSEMDRFFMSEEEVEKLNKDGIEKNISSRMHSVVKDEVTNIAVIDFEQLCKDLGVESVNADSKARILAKSEQLAAMGAENQVGDEIQSALDDYKDNELWQKQRDENKQEDDNIKANNNDGIKAFAAFIIFSMIIIVIFKII
jgi:predicted DNA-binding protein